MILWETFKLLKSYFEHFIRDDLFLHFFNNWRLNPRYYDYFDKLLRLENVKLFSQDKDNILATTILILYRKLHINIVSIIVFNIEAIQYNMKINLAISCSPKFSKLFHILRVECFYTFDEFLARYIYEEKCVYRRLHKALIFIIKTLYLRAYTGI